MQTQSIHQMTGKMDYFSNQAQKIIDISTQMKLNMGNQQNSHEIQSYPFTIKVYYNHIANRITIYLESEYDLYLFYYIEFTQNEVRSMMDNYNLKVYALNQFLQMLKCYLNDVLNKSKQISVTIKKQNSMKITFLQQYADKTIVVLSFSLNHANEEVISEVVALRYGLLRQELVEKQQRIFSMKQLIRHKNPYLLKQIAKKL